MRPPMPQHLPRPIARAAALWLRRLAVGASACALLVATAGLAWDRDRMNAAAQRAGPRAAAAAKSLQALLTEAPAGDEPALLGAVNDFFNRRVLFVDDAAVWGQDDYWASPLEMLEKGRGDCEDYAIAKYFSLLAAGVPVARLRLVYVRAAVGGPGGVVQPHMVLAWYAQPGAADPGQPGRRGAAGLAPPRPDAGVQLQQRRPVAGRGRCSRRRPDGAAVALARSACEGAGRGVPMSAGRTRCR
jgi:predicted transglutaminase-like cysteine proteinase